MAEKKKTNRILITRTCSSAGFHYTRGTVLRRPAPALAQRLITMGNAVDATEDADLEKAVAALEEETRTRAADERQKVEDDAAASAAVKARLAGAEADGAGEEQ